jgi:HD-GYP domain-containing protein (c-di-GMP phosphodiesterase class II)
VLLASQMGMRRRRIAGLAEAARLLDIGLAHLAPHVARRSGRLTDDEEASFRMHPFRSPEIVREIGLMAEGLAGIAHHHERFDGRGYPMGLARHEIPEFARILAIADAFDRMTRPGLSGVAISPDDAVAELRTAAGSNFDPVLVDAFDHAVRRQRRTS